MSNKQVRRELALLNKLENLQLAQMPGNGRRRRRQRQRQRRRLNGTVSGIVPVMTSAPSAGSVIVNRRKTVPKITQSGECTYIQNTEQFFSVPLAAAGAFTQVSSVLIPSNFSWILGPSASFSKWRWLGLRIIYIPTVPTTTAGRISMALDYDLADAVPTTMTQIQQMYQSTTSAVWAGYEGSALLQDPNRPISSIPGAVALELDVNRLSEQYYPWIGIAAFGALTTAAQKNIYCPAQLFIGTNGGIAGTGGDLFIQYKIELIEPVPTAVNT